MFKNWGQILLLYPPSRTFGPRDLWATFQIETNKHKNKGLWTATKEPTVEHAFHSCKWLWYTAHDHIELFNNSPQKKKGIYKKVLN